MANKEQSGGMVFYPREYHIGADHLLSYAYGFDHNDNPVIAFIIPTDHALERAGQPNTANTVPSILEFSSTGRRARNPCSADKNNCRRKPSGMLLLEQVKTAEEFGYEPQCLKPEFMGMQVYVARWASNLREATDVPRAPIGSGYLEVSFSYQETPEITSLLKEYEEVNHQFHNHQINKLEFNSQAARITMSIFQAKRKFFSAIMLQTHLIERIEDVASFQAKAYQIFEKYTVKGMYGSFILRTLTADGKKVIRDLSAQCHAKFRNNQVENFQKTINEFMQYHGNEIFTVAGKNGYIVEIIPSIKINCGPRGVDKYSKEFNAGDVPKCMKTFLESSSYKTPYLNTSRDKAFLFSDIAIRLYQIEPGRSGAGNYLVSGLHSFSRPKGNFLTIDRNGESTLGFAQIDASKLVA